MAKTAVIQTRVDAAIKQKAQHVLEKMNMSMSEAVALYLHQIALQNKIPFPVRTPNALTAATLKDSEEGKELRHVASVDQLFEELAQCTDSGNTERLSINPANVPLSSARPPHF